MSVNVVIAYIGLGSNQDNPSQQIAQAQRELGSAEDCEVLVASSCFSSRPMGPQDQDDYCNAVVCLKTRLTADNLLAHLQSIEQKLGRQRKIKWGPRVIDLDLLLYGDDEIETPGLTVPHPGIAERDFVLVPLDEIAPNQRVPGKGLVKELLSQLKETYLVKVT